MQENAGQKRHDDCSHVGRRRETRLHNQAGGLYLARKLDRRSAAERLTENYYPLRRYASLICQIIPRGASVNVQTLFGWLAFTLSVPAIIDDEHLNRERHHRADHVIPIAYVSGVAVKPKHDRLSGHRVGRSASFAVRRAVPAVKPQSIAC